MNKFVFVSLNFRNRVIIRKINRKTNKIDSVSIKNRTIALDSGFTLANYVMLKIEGQSKGTKLVVALATQHPQP